MAGFAVARVGSGQSLPEAEPMAAPTPWYGAVARSFEDGVRTRNFLARQSGWEARLLGRRVQAGLPGWRAPLPGTADTALQGFSGLAGGLGDEDPEIEALRRKDPERMKAVPTLERLAADYDAELRDVRRRSEEGAADHPVWSFIGGVGGALADPINLVGGVATGAWGAGRPLLTRMLAQAGANVAIEGAEIPFRFADAAVFGPDYSPVEAAQDVVFAGVGGAAFEGAGGLARAGLRRLFDSADPGVRAAAEGLDTLDRDAAAVGDQPGEDFDAALAALQDGRPRPALAPGEDIDRMFADAPPAPPPGEAGGPVTITASRDYRGRPTFAASFDPAALDVAPRTFQYKADGDAQGVTARLRGVEAWDDSASGKIMVWQARDGRMVVADGHQRRGLARRMADKGFEVRLDGMLFREADGWAARDVRVLAALKNIREGSGSILDAAKVFRDAPDALRDRSLPLTGEFMAQARGLAKLDKEAFGAVVNKVIPERYGAEIGTLAGQRPDLHGAMVKLLREGEPANGDEARAMIVEALQDDWIRTEGETADLFGYDATVSAMASRAKVAAAVKRAIARDEKLFGQLVRNADAIEAGGNALAREANEAALAIDRTALELVSKLALRHGPIGEAMSEAAGKVARGEAGPAAASKGIVQMVRTAIKAGERLDEARGASLDPAPPSPTAGELVAGFDEYGGKAAADQAAVAPEDADLETTPGLFEDLAETGADERAHARLIQCAPGGL